MKDAAVEMGKGPVITIVDSSGRGLIANRKVVQWLKKPRSVPCNPGAVRSRNRGNNRCDLHSSVPRWSPKHYYQPATRYIHSPVEVLDIGDIEAVSTCSVAALKTKPAL